MPPDIDSTPAFDLKAAVAAICDHHYACTPEDIPNVAGRMEGILISAMPELQRMFAAHFADLLEAALPRLACGFCRMELPLDERGGHMYHDTWFQCYPDFEASGGIHTAIHFLRRSVP